MPENKGYLTSDRSTAGDERYTPVYAVVPLLEFAPPPHRVKQGFGVRLIKNGLLLCRCLEMLGTK